MKEEVVRELAVLVVLGGEERTVVGEGLVSEAAEETEDLAAYGAADLQEPGRSLRPDELLPSPDNLQFCSFDITLDEVQTRDDTPRPQLVECQHVHRPALS